MQNPLDELSDQELTDLATSLEFQVSKLEDEIQRIALAQKASEQEASSSLKSEEILAKLHS
jgi:hypothetical protein